MSYYTEYEWSGSDEPPEPMTLDEIARDEVYDMMEAEIDATDPGCQCYMGGLYSLGSVESMRAGETDPLCPIHGVDEVRSGAFASWGPVQRSQFVARLASSVGKAGDE